MVFPTTIFYIMDGANACFLMLIRTGELRKAIQILEVWQKLFQDCVFLFVCFVANYAQVRKYCDKIGNNIILESSVSRFGWNYDILGK